ncbi:Complement C4-A, partial [Manis pentadactyla]
KMRVTEETKKMRSRSPWVPGLTCSCSCCCHMFRWAQGATWTASHVGEPYGEHTRTDEFL